MLKVDASCDEGPSRHPAPFYRLKCAATVCNQNISLYIGKKFLKAGLVGWILNDVMQPAVTVKMTFGILGFTF